MADRKKALIVTRVSGFVPQFEMNNVKILQDMGYEVHYASNFKTVVYGTNNDRLQGTGIVCHDMPFCRSPFSLKVFKAYRQLKELLVTEQFDLIHCHMPMTGVVTRMAAQAVRKRTKRVVPVLYTTHGFHFFRGAPIKNWIYYIPERWLARYTDRLITINEEDYERACTFRVRGKAEKIPGVGIASLSDRFSDADSRHLIREQKREELKINSSDYLLFSVGELNQNKNHIQIIKALAGNGDISLKYFICGMGPLREELEEQIKALGLEKQVRLLGYRSDIRELLFAADCFVFPSLREGLSVALMEAMRAGLPVVAKKIRGNVDLIENGKGGFLLENGTKEEYLGAIRQLKNSRELAECMGKWNRERVKEFSGEKAVVEMERIYEEVLE